MGGMGAALMLSWHFREKTKVSPSLVLLLSHFDKSHIVKVEHTDVVSLFCYFQHPERMGKSFVWLIKY